MKIRVDGREVQVAPGSRLLDVLRAEGVSVPTLCDSPGLTPAGHCRLCVVELEGKGLVASCMTVAEAGMSILSESGLVQRSRRTTLELILADHPMDCLACAKNGRCGLQTVAGQIGVDPARLERARSAALSGDRRQLVANKDESNPFFVHDPGKCVICGICTRTCEELQGVGAIQLVADAEHGMRVVAGTGGLLTDSNCESCGECVVRCPTGALVEKKTERPSRETKTTCTYCGVGCGVVLGIRGNEIVSVRGEPESPVNGGALCVKGRFGYSFVHSPKRLRTPLIRKSRTEPFKEASWDEALDFVAARLKQYPGNAFAGISSSRATNEENYLMQKFARAAMRTNNIDNCARLCHAPTVSGLSKSLGTGGGTNPLSDLDGADCILVVGSNTTEAHSVAGARLRRAARKAKLIVVDPRRIELVDHADLWLPLKFGTDVALFMAMAKVILDEHLEDRAFIDQRCEGFDQFVQAANTFDLERASAITGVSADLIREAARAYAASKRSMIIWSLGITEHTHGTDNVMALANLALLTGNIGRPSAGLMPMRGQNNVQGACDMGCIPGAFPGSQSVTKPEVLHKFEQAWGTGLPAVPGLGVVEMLQAAERGEVKALYIMGMDVAYSVSDTKRTQAALKQAEFVIVQDILMTGTAQFADVILPAASFAEKDGTFTNLERRVQLVRKAIEPVGQSKPDWWILGELARRMGVAGFEYRNAAEIMAEMASLTPSFAGFSFARLENGGIQWPCTGLEHAGTERLHVEKFNTSTGKGRFSALTYRPPVESADPEFPIILTTGRSLYHFHLAMTTEVAGLMALHPEERVWVHPEDARSLGLNRGDRARVISRRGDLVVGVHVTDAVQRGTAYMTFHFYDQPTNVLTHQELDPVAKTPEFKVTAVRIEKA